MKIYTTFRLLREYGTCRLWYRRFAKKLGGVRKYGVDRPISLLMILKHNGIGDAMWVVVAGVVPPEQLETAKKFEHIFIYRTIMLADPMFLKHAPKIFRGIYKEMGLSKG